MLAVAVRRSSPDSRGPTPTQEDGLADSTNTDDAQSSIAVISQVPRIRQRCRDYDGE